MIDIYKYSKKNKIYEFIILKILKINVQLLTKPLFLNFNLNIDIDEKFFYEYREKYPITSWMEMEEVSKFYQSNHDLTKLAGMKKLIKNLEKILNTEVKYKIFESSVIGRFKIKNIWFTIQKKNEGHHSHNHPKSVLSGVYYFKINNNSGGEINLDLENEKITHLPQKNDLLIFNSTVHHSVNPYFGNNDRIAIAWDAIYTF